MSFKVGDRVRIITKQFEGNSVGTHFGCTGIIKSLYDRRGDIDHWNVVRDDRIHLGDAASILYSEEHLEPEVILVMLPEMELEEIEKAQEVFASLQP